MAGLKRKAAAPLPISEPDEPLFADSPDNQDSLEGDDSDGPGPDGADEDDDEGGLGFKAGVDDYDEDEDQLEDDEEEPESDDDPFQDSLNPDSRFQPPSLHTDSSGDDDSDESDYADEVAGPSTRKKNGGGKATLGGSRRMVTARKGNGRRTANRGKGKERVRDVEDDDEEMEEEDEEADENENEDDLAGGIGDGDEDDAGAEFDDLLISLQKSTKTAPPDSNLTTLKSKAAKSTSNAEHRHAQTQMQSAIAADMLHLRSELAEAAGFKRKHGRKRTRRGARNDKVEKDRKYPPEIENLLAEGMAAWGTGGDENLEEGRKKMYEVIRLDSTVPEAWMTLSSIFHEQGLPDKEMACLFIGAHCKRSEGGETWRDLAERSAELGRWDQAVYCVGRAVRCQPGDEGMRFCQGEMFARAGMMDKAWKTFEPLLKTAPYDIFLLKATQNIYVPINKLQIGIDLFDNAFRYHTSTFSGPSDISTLNNYANALDFAFVYSFIDLLLVGSHWEDAGRVIKKAMRWFQGRKDEEFWDSQMDDKEFDPEGVGAAQRGEVEAVAGQKSRPGEGDDRGGYELVKEMRWRLAVVRFKLGWDVDAKIHMNEYLKEKDLECLKENWQGWNNIGLALIDRKLHDKALFIFEELWEGLLDEAEIMDPAWIARAGECRLETKDAEGAITAFEMILEHQQTEMGFRDRDVLKNLARAHLAMNDIAAADRVYTELRAEERHQAEIAGQALQDAASGSADTGALIPRKRRTAPAPRKTPGTTRREREDAEAKQARDSFDLLKEVEEMALAGNDDAREMYMETAGMMIAEFRAATSLFPIDKSRKFFKLGEGPSKNQRDYQQVPEPGMADAGVDGVQLVPVQRVAFQGLHADIWLEIVITYCCFLMLENDELAAMDILNHVSWTNIFNPLKYTFPIQLALLSAAIRLSDQESIMRICRVIMMKFQFRSEPVALFQAAVGTGMDALGTATNLNWQKALNRELKQWDASAEGKNFVFNEGLFRWVWKKSEEDRRMAAERRAKRDERAKVKNALKRKAISYRGRRGRLPGGLANARGQRAPAGQAQDEDEEEENAQVDEEGVDQPGEDDGYESEPEDDQDEDEEDVDQLEGGQEQQGGVAMQRDRSGSSAGAGEASEADGAVKVIRRQAFERPKQRSPQIYLAYGQTMLSAKSYQSAIYYFLKAYEYNPYDPLLCLHLAQSYIGRAMNRQSDNRLHQISTGMAFMNRYRRLMDFQAENDEQKDEVEYNFGRAFHGLGVFHLAVKHYQVVLHRISQRMTDSADPEMILERSIARDAAYNLTVIYHITGAHALAKTVTEQWMSV